jgi:phage terminase large subunit-like protein
MSEKKQRRFLFGEYSDDSERALWKREWISNNRITSQIKDMAKDLRRVVIAVDPAVTGLDTSDDTGIIAVGTFMYMNEIHYVVLGDYTYHGDVTGWGEEVVRVYHKWQADRVVGEVNQGGDLVKANIRNYDSVIRFDSVRATRGKAVRAEPVADLYRRGYVHHLGVHQELEDQMCTWTPEDNESPDNMDALVWGISYLTGFGNQQASITMWG